MERKIGYIPVDYAVIEKLGERWAYANLLQDRYGLDRIREHLDNSDIDACMFVTETGDYTEIYVSFYEGRASFAASKQWYRVTDVWVKTDEEEAVELGRDKLRLRNRLWDARKVLVDEYKKYFKFSRFDFENKCLYGVYITREYPSAPVIRHDSEYRLQWSALDGEGTAHHLGHIELLHTKTVSIDELAQILKDKLGEDGNG